MSALVSTVDPTVQRASAIARFTELRLAAQHILNRAANLPGLPPLLVAQGRAAAGIAGTRFHQVHGEPGADDAHALIADLQALWGFVDPFIAAIGDEATGSFRVDQSDFRDQLRGALEGNATFALETAAEELAEDDHAPSIDPNREHRTHPGHV